MAVCGKSLKQHFDEEDRGLLKDSAAAGKASSVEKTPKHSNIVGDKQVSEASGFSSSSSSLFESKQSGRSIQKGDRMISASRRFACKEGCKHCAEDTFHGDEVSQPHVIRRRESIQNINWGIYESSRPNKTVRFE